MKKRKTRDQDIYLEQADFHGMAGLIIHRDGQRVELSQDVHGLWICVEGQRVWVSEDHARQIQAWFKDRFYLEQTQLVDSGKPDPNHMARAETRNHR